MRKSSRQELKRYGTYLPDNTSYLERESLYLFRSLRRQFKSLIKTGRIAISFFVVFLLCLQQFYSYAQTYERERSVAAGEITPYDEEAGRAGRLSPEQLETQQRLQEGLIERKEVLNGMVTLIRYQPTPEEAEDMPLKKVGAGGKIIVEEVRVEKPEEPVKKAEEPRKNGAISAAKKAAEITVPIGVVLLIKDGADSGRKAYDWLTDRIDSMKDGIGSQEIQFEMKDVPWPLQKPLEQLLDVKGVDVKVPGTDFAVAKASLAVPSRLYNVEDILFTIDAITLDKVNDGEFEIRVPAEAKKDFENKVLCLAKIKDKHGKTIEDKLLEGDVETLAMVLAEWARYAVCGFSFDKETESTMAKAIVKVVGVGAQSKVVRIVDNGLKRDELGTVLLEKEIDKIVGEDKEAKERIMTYIYPEGTSPGVLKTYPTGQIERKGQERVGR